jgi:hypothetical protein
VLARSRILSVFIQSFETPNASVKLWWRDGQFEVSYISRDDPFQSMRLRRWDEANALFVELVNEARKIKPRLALVSVAP